MIIFTPISEKIIKEKQTIPKFDVVRMTIEKFQNWNPEVTYRSSLKKWRFT